MLSPEIMAQICMDIEKYISFLMQNEDVIYGPNQCRRYGDVFCEQEIRAIQKLLTETMYIPVGENSMAIFITSGRDLPHHRLTCLKLQSLWILAKDQSSSQQRFHMLLQSMKCPIDKYSKLEIHNSAALHTILETVFDQIIHTDRLSQRDPASLTRLASKRLTKGTVKFLVEQLPNVFMMTNNKGVYLHIVTI